MKNLQIEATYSAEDNKLRLYAASRLDDELFKRVKENGFRWAPKQELFVAPKWTPCREDFCLELTREITAEQTTIVERAEAKAERLDALAVKRSQQANSFYDAANKIAERFAGGQPILVGHHSEKKARRDKSKMEVAQDKAAAAYQAVSYWNYRAGGVERHANMKGNEGVRVRRIKTLLAELRDRQRDINHAKICLKLWTKIDAEAENREGAIRSYVGGRLSTGATAPYSLWSMLNRNEISPGDAIERCLAHHEYHASSPYTLRWIAHILNRLAFERAELGNVVRFPGEITAVILQVFAREHGAHKPEATRSGTSWTLASTVDLPAHIADSNTLSIDADAWRDLMQSSGYEVPIAKVRRRSTAKKAPLINPTVEEAERLQAIWNLKARERWGHTTLGGIKVTEVTRMSQGCFSANSKGDYSSLNTIELDSSGDKVRRSYKGASAEAVCRIRSASGGGSVYSPESIIILDDKPTKPLPIEWVAA